MSILPWAEPVTYTSTRTAGSVTAVVPGCGVYVQGEREAAPSNGRVLAGDLAVSLPTPLPGGLGEPKSADVVVWRGRAYTVLGLTGESDWNPPGDYWPPFRAVNCRNARIAFGLRQVLSLVRPAQAPGAGGLAATVASPVVWTGDGRLQPDDIGVEPFTAGRHTGRGRYTAYLAGAVRVQAGDHIVDTADPSKRYEVTGQAGIDQLGVLTSVSCERTT